MKSSWKILENRIYFTKNLGKKLGFTKLEDFYQLKVKTFTKNKGYGVIAHHNFSVFNAIKEAFPNYHWLAWLFPQVPANYYDEKENRAQFVINLVKIKDYKKYENYYLLSKDDFRSNGGATLIEKHYKCHPYYALKETFPEYNWLPWLFYKVPEGFWDEIENQKWFLKNVEIKLKILKPEDWYNVTQDDINAVRGSGLIGKYNGCQAKLITACFTEYNLKLWKFSRIPAELWDKTKNFNDYMDWLGEISGFKTLEDYYKLRRHHFTNNFGSNLFQNHFNCSIYNILKAYKLDYEWLGWLLEKAPNGFWQIKENRMAYMKWLEKKLNIKKVEDWYKLKTKHFIKYNGGGLLLHYYNGNKFLALKEYLPNYEWKEWIFGMVSRNFYKNNNNHIRFMTYLGDKLGFKQPEDWYSIRALDFQMNYGWAFLVSYYKGSPALAVMAFIPDYPWKIEKFVYSSKSQQRLFQTVKKLFPNKEVKWNYRSDDLRFSESNLKMEIDVYVKEEKIGFEYQSELHFLPIEFFGGKKEFEKRKKRDIEKIQKCKEKGIKLIQVDYSWNGDKKTIQKLLKEGV